MEYTRKSIKVKEIYGKGCLGGGGGEVNISV